MDIDVAMADRLLTTTRAVRKRLDLTRPVPLEVVRACLDVALQAPTGGNVQLWRWVVVDDREQRERIAECYRECWAAYRPTLDELRYPEGDPRREQHAPTVDSSQYLTDHIHEVPVLLVPCVSGYRADADLAWLGTLFASVMPAVWSFMLAARARRLGTVLTTLTMMRSADINDILGIPSNVMHCGVIPVAYYTGEGFSPAPRLALDAVAFSNRWKSPLPSA
jgi:nitroreductase